MHRLTTPRIVVAGLGGDSGKTLVTLGLIRALRRRDLTIQPFKKGPDYIDPAWLGLAAGRTCRNLDTYLMAPRALDRAVVAASEAEIAVIEGNRGLFDGADAAGTHSTAELAKRLQAPVILVVDATKVTRTVAAMVLGCRALDPDMRLAGVVLNRIGGSRHEGIVREAVETGAGVPVLGAVPRLSGDDPLPSRHLGLMTADEHPRRDESIDRAADAVADAVDLEAVLALARTAPSLRLDPAPLPDRGPRVRIGVFVDEAFTFYYPENLEGLEAAGVELVQVAPGRDGGLPSIDGLYIGGGFPEVHAARLAANDLFTRAVREAVADGLPVYAECGGLMYLSKNLRVEGVDHPMAGVLDLEIEQTSRPVGHGYVTAVADRDSDFLAKDTHLAGHEFHYSHIRGGEDLENTVLSLERGVGTGQGRDGIVRGTVWASYLHLHALATPTWADGFLRQVRDRAHATLIAGTALWG